tara:strand:+ start:21 stop:578 length:558 start_codon:yes stop_codon:yes gene_type:complete
MFIQSEPTPNPLTLKFLPGREVIESGTVFYETVDDAKNSPLAKRIFSNIGVKSVFFGNNFISVTKSEDVHWQDLKPLVINSITEHYDSGENNIEDTNEVTKAHVSKATDSDIVLQIKDLIDTRVRPAVSMDGGDIIYEKFEEGIVYLRMQGACSGCPSSTATLKAGIENMLKHYIPEVKEVKAVV